MTQDIITIGIVAITMICVLVVLYRRLTRSVKPTCDSCQGCHAAPTCNQKPTAQPTCEKSRYPKSRHKPKG